MGFMFVISLLAFYSIQTSECQNLGDSSTSDTSFSSTGLPFARCSNDYNSAEMYNGLPVDCSKQRCSPGFDCDYNRNYEYNRVLQPQNPLIVQYICCGNTPLRPGQPTGAPFFTPPRIPVTSGFVPPPRTGLGEVMMTYFDPTAPMKCYSQPNCSLFPYYLNCVDSARYRTKVCCSSTICP